MRRPLGDPLPPALAEYYGAIDAGRLDAAAESFTTDAVYAVALPGVPETGARTVTVGSAALRHRFGDRGPQPWRHVALLCVADGHDALVEGVLHDPADRPIATFVGSARISDGGGIGRYLAFSCHRGLDPIPLDVADDTEPADAATVVHDYFVALDEGRFEAAARQFSDDVIYSHPPYQHTGIDDPDRIEFRGRAALHGAFLARGRTSFSHEVLTSIQRGPHCLFEGAVNDLPDGGSGSFISSLSLAPDGTIRRYVSFYCEPGVPSSVQVLATVDDEVRAGDEA